MKKIIIILAMAMSFGFINNARADLLTQLGNEIAVGIAKRTFLPILDDYAGQILVMIGQEKYIKPKNQPKKVYDTPCNKIIPYSMQPGAQLPETNKPSMKMGILNIYIR